MDGTEDERLWKDANEVSFLQATKAKVKLSDNKNAYNMSFAPFLPPATIAEAV